jgi:uncharacterized repeat protein (TIGR03806 family)
MRIKLKLFVWAVAILMCNGMVQGADSDSEYGLNSRPANYSCLAPEKPQPESAYTTIELYKSLKLRRIIHMQQSPDAPGFWYAADRLGMVYRFSSEPDVTSKTVALDITAVLAETATNADDSQQWGVTSIAFHPDIENNPYLYVAYNARFAGVELVRSNVARFALNPDGISFDATSEEVVFSHEQPTPWHHIGQIAFGPDGYLYIGSGDPNRAHGQNLESVSGKILRIDVTGPLPYAIPPDNPFVGEPEARAEIFAYGIRNPWRFSFDRNTGEMYVGDVGASDWESILKVEKGSNFGFPITEGSHCYLSETCDKTGLIDPIYEYPHSEGIAVIGGYVYRGAGIPDLNGVYLFSDFPANAVFALYPDESGGYQHQAIASLPIRVTGFSEDDNGDVFIYSSQDKGIYKLILDPNPGNLAGSFPDMLSKTNCFDPDDTRKPGPGLVPYDVISPLWTDGAVKGRWMAIPENSTVDTDTEGNFVFPIGTVLLKEFAFNGSAVETRLFVRHAEGDWAGYSYEWLSDGSDAVLLTEGKTKYLEDVNVDYGYPSRSQCMQCHTEAAGYSIGPEIQQLNAPMYYPSTGKTANQLSTLEFIGYLSEPLPDTPNNLPSLAKQGDYSKTLHHRARSLLHSNCSYCHRDGGITQASLDFRFQLATLAIGACNTTPDQGDLGVPGALLITPGDAGKSIIPLRLNATNSEQMPPVGRSTVDPAVAEVLERWINEFDLCGQETDSDLDGHRDDADNCPNNFNPDQSDADLNGRGDICQQSTTFIPGIPDINTATDRGVYLWREYYDGPYKLRASSGGQGLYKTDITVVSDSEITEIVGYELSGKDTLEVERGRLSLSSQVWTWFDGVDFNTQAGSRSYVAIRSSGVPNPADYYVGPEKLGVGFYGWTRSVDDIGKIPEFSPAEDLGVFIGKDNNGLLSLRWNSNGPKAVGDFEFVSSMPISSLEGIKLGFNDILIAESDTLVHGTMNVTSWYDGIDIGIEPGSYFVFTNLRDGMQDYGHINPFHGVAQNAFGFPDTSRLPEPRTKGAPGYSRYIDGGIYIYWEDDTTLVLKLVAGGSIRRAQARLAFSSNIISIVEVGLSIKNDFVVQDGNDVMVDTVVWGGGGTDEVRVTLSVPGEVLLSLDTDVQIKDVLIGPDKWPILNRNVTIAEAL